MGIFQLGENYPLVEKGETALYKVSLASALCSPRLDDFYAIRK